MRPSKALILMAKAPLPGTVKTRLCPPLTAASAASLYAGMLSDLAEEVGAGLRGVRRYLFFFPPGTEAEAHFDAKPFRRFERVLQRGRNLGERMDRAIRVALSDGARRVVVIGADCPFLTASRIRSAFRELSGPADLVFGPSEDGGFYLIGASFPVTDLFRGVAWGTGSALAEVASRCRRSGLSFAFLPTEFDVDRPADLDALRRRFAGRLVPACPRTRRWLGGSTGVGPAPSGAGRGSASSRGPGRRFHTGR
ncbi:MAG: hypothetical protein Kow00128_03930 [Deltaproteobacteria bacterium]